ncbi:MAG: hypothetical protein ABI304_01995 [Rudaea sp.]
MSNTEIDAWLEEKSTGDWPFDRWLLSEFSLREDHNYFDVHRPSVGLGPLLHSALQAFGPPKRRAKLENVLHRAVELVETAIDISQADARDSWVSHEAWLSVIDESLSGEDDPAEIVIESIVMTHTDDATAQELCAAVALWAFGEYAYYAKIDDRERKAWAIRQGAISFAEAQFRFGLCLSERKQLAKLTRRNREAANKGHIANRENKLRGQEIWKSRAWTVQADAERAIAKACSITKEVAGRWVRQFKHSN